MAGRHCSTGTWVAQCTAEEMSRKNREKISLGAKSEQGIWNLGLTGQTAKAPKNEHTMQKRMCWDANVPGVDDYGCQTLQQCTGRWVARCIAEEMSRKNLAGSLCI